MTWGDMDWTSRRRGCSIQPTLMLTVSISGRKTFTWERALLLNCESANPAVKFYILILMSYWKHALSSFCCSCPLWARAWPMISSLDGLHVCFKPIQVCRLLDLADVWWYYEWQTANSWTTSFMADPRSWLHYKKDLTPQLMESFWTWQ